VRHVAISTDTRYCPVVVAVNSRTGVSSKQDVLCELGAARVPNTEVHVGAVVVAHADDGVPRAAREVDVHRLPGAAVQAAGDRVAVGRVALLHHAARGAVEVGADLLLEGVLRLRLRDGGAAECGDDETGDDAGVHSNLPIKDQYCQVVVCGRRCKSWA